MNMEKVANYERIEEYQRLLLDLLSTGSESFEMKNIHSPLFNAMTFAEIVYPKLYDLGKKKLEMIKSVVDPQNFGNGIIDETVSLFYGDTQNIYTSRETISRDNLTCALRIIKTYQTIMDWQTKLEEFRKLKTLDDIL